MNSLIRAFIPLFAGLLFGIGLMVSKMVDPMVVLGFLDIAGDWNPSLAFVMGGAVLVTLPAFAYARARGISLLGEKIALPDRKTLTKPLVIGSALFGLGWGLGGVCPGPSVLIATGDGPGAELFFISMLGGMFVFELRSRLGKR